MQSQHIHSRRDLWKVGDEAFSRHRKTLLEEAAEVVVDATNTDVMAWLAGDESNDWDQSRASRLILEDRELRQAVVRRLHDSSIATLDGQDGATVQRFAKKFRLGLPRVLDSQSAEMARAAFAGINSDIAQVDSMNAPLETDSAGPRTTMYLNGASVAAQLVQHPDAMRFLLSAVPVLKQAQSKNSWLSLEKRLQFVLEVPQALPIEEVRALMASGSAADLEQITKSEQILNLEMADEIIKLLGRPDVHNSVGRALGLELQKAVSQDEESVRYGYQGHMDFERLQLAADFMVAFDLDRPLTPVADRDARVAIDRADINLA